MDYGDLLGVTLPANARHFQKILVVSARHDAETAAIVASVPNAELFITDAFYRRSAAFNKGLGMEEGFEVLGREGWINVLDADILLPDVLPLPPLEIGQLYSLHRRILDDPSLWTPELPWTRCRRHTETEFAGYFQLFHAADPVLQQQPWYGVDWMHAGGCDSVFQEKWAVNHKVRLNIDALHLGEIDTNWCGRATKRMDGAIPENAQQRRDTARNMLKLRRQFGKHDNRRYLHERLR